MTGGAVGVVEESRADGFAVGDHVLHGLGWREVAVLDAERRAGRRRDGRPGIRLPRRARHDRAHRVRRPDPHRRRSSPATSSSSRARPAPWAARSARSPRRSARAGSSAAPARPRRCATSSRTSGSTRRSTTRTARSRSSCARRRPTASTSTSTTSAVSTSRPRSGSLRLGGRIAVCGMISVYNDTEPAPGPAQPVAPHPDPRPHRGLPRRRPLRPGRASTPACAAQWLGDGRLQSRETFVDGIDGAVDAFLGVLRGENTGKMVVRL